MAFDPRKRERRRNGKERKSVSFCEEVLRRSPGPEEGEWEVRVVGLRC